LGRRKLGTICSIHRTSRLPVLAVYFLISGALCVSCSRETSTSHDAANTPEGTGAAPISLSAPISSSFGANLAIKGAPAAAQHTNATPAALLEELASIAASTASEDGRRVEVIFNLLGEAGYSGLWAIKEYLLDSQQSADEPASAEQALRQALLDFLLGSGQPGVEGLALELLTKLPGPMDVAQLGRYLEANHPGKYTQLIRTAAEQALTGADSFADIPGSLFQLLGEIGDTSTISLLVDMPMHRDAYVSVALALLPDGSGIPLLEQDARLFEIGQYTTHGRLAIELLAQQAYQFSDAAKVLIDLANKNLIPSDLWPQVVALLAGEQRITLVPPAGSQTAWNTIYRSQGNQALYLATRSPEQETSEQIDRRLYVLGQLQQLAPPAFMRQFHTAQDRLNELRQGLSAVSTTSNSITALHRFYAAELPHTEESTTS
jgi:hypothetical protein